MRLEGRNDHIDHSSALEAVMESQGLGKHGEHVKEEDVRQLMQMAKMPDLEEYERELDRQMQSGQLQRCTFLLMSCLHDCRWLTIFVC